MEQVSKHDHASAETRESDGACRPARIPDAPRWARPAHSPSNWLLSSYQLDAAVMEESGRGSDPRHADSPQPCHIFGTVSWSGSSSVLPKGCEIVGKIWELQRLAGKRHSNRVRLDAHISLFGRVVGQNFYVATVLSEDTGGRERRVWPSLGI